MTVNASNTAEAESGVVVTRVVTTAVAAPVDAEKQQPASSTIPTTAAHATSSPHPADDEAGKGMGIAMTVVILVGLICNWLFPIISFVCIITAIVLSSILTCSCCCAADYNLQPHVKKFAMATLASLCLIFIIQIIYFIAVASVAATEASDTGTISTRTMDGASTGLIIVGVISLLLNFIALIFSAIFTWGRGCCAPRT